MSTSPDNDLDLEKLFLPAWAQEPSTARNYENYRGEEAPSRRREAPYGQRPPRRDRPPGQGPGGGRPQQRGDRPGGDRPGGERRGDQGRGPQGRPGDRRGRGDRFQGRPEQRREAPPPLPEVNINLVPEEKGVESLARQIKITGRAYPLFDIAQMILQKPERHCVAFSIRKNPEGAPIQPLFLCAIDESLWLTEDEAIAHVLHKHFATFYQADRTPTEPPKGRYTFVAQCGMSGVVLGPPNHHDYQNQLRKLHAERFSRMPFEAYKARVRIVSDEAVVKKWVEDQSWKTEYLCLNTPDQLKLTSMEAVEKHFRETHKEVIIKQVDSYTLSGTAARNLRCAPLSRAFRVTWEDQRRFPLQIATTLSQQFASRGLQFFKVNKTLTHVSVARPHYLDLAATPVSEGVRKIVEHLNEHPRCTRRHLLDVLLPPQALKPVPPPPPAPPIQASPAVEQAPPTVSDQGAPETATTGSEEAPPAGAAPAAPPARPEPTPEQTALIADLHWLIHQGHVIEFANGTIETAKKPAPKPPKPEKKPAQQPADQASTEAQAQAPAEAPAASETAQAEAATVPDTTASAPDTESSPESAAPAQEQPKPEDTTTDSSSPEAKDQPAVQAADAPSEPASSEPPTAAPEKIETPEAPTAPEPTDRPQQ
jgi:hypothetical protein